MALQHKRCEVVIDMAQSRLLVVAALLGLQAGALAEDTPAPSSIAPTVSPQTITLSPTIMLSPTAYTPPNNEDDMGWTDAGGCEHKAQNAVLFPFVVLALGALTMYLTSRYAPDVPYTVIMLVEGFLIGWHPTHGRGGDADTTESQRDMLDLTMTNAWSATTTASTRTRHRGTEEFSEI